jgi:hypothetical protein
MLIANPFKPVKKINAYMSAAAAIKIVHQNSATPKPKSVWSVWRIKIAKLDKSVTRKL